MSRKNRTIDVAAGAALLGMVAVGAMAQVGGPDPEPITQTCPGFTEYRFDDQIIVIEPWPCPVDQVCIKIRIRDEQGRIIAAAGGCAIPS